MNIKLYTYNELANEYKQRAESTTQLYVESCIKEIYQDLWEHFLATWELTPAGELLEVKEVPHVQGSNLINKIAQVVFVDDVGFYNANDLFREASIYFLEEWDITDTLKSYITLTQSQVLEALRDTIVEATANLKMMEMYLHNRTLLYSKNGRLVGYVMGGETYLITTPDYNNTYEITI